MPDMLTILKALDRALRMGVQVEIPPRPPRAGLMPEYVSKDEFANNIYYAGYTPIIYLPNHLLPFSCALAVANYCSMCRERKPPGLDPLVVLLPPRRHPARS